MYDVEMGLYQMNLFVLNAKILCKLQDLETEGKESTAKTDVSKRILELM